MTRTIPRRLAEIVLGAGVTHHEPVFTRKPHPDVSRILYNNCASDKAETLTGLSSSITKHGKQARFEVKQYLSYQ